MALAAAGGSLLVLVPMAAGYWVWNMSAHLGMAGEPSPQAAVATWFRAMYPGMGTPDNDVERLVCSRPAAGRPTCWTSSGSGQPTSGARTPT